MANSTSGMYTDLAEYYDLIYTWKDYKKEAKKINALISKYKKSPGNSLLDVGCGTGKHLQYLDGRFHCMGLDSNEGMLRIARSRLPNIAFKNGNMINFRLNKKFDVITCLFSAIGYVKTYENLKKTLNNFSEHLKPGGVLIIEPWFTRSEYKIGMPHMSIYQGKDIKIARLNISEAKNGVSVLDMHHLIAERNKGVKYIVSRGELGMFETSSTLKLMKTAGLNAKFLKKPELDAGRGLYVGIKL